MTLIATFEVSRVPILIGDLLVSEVISQAPPLALPLVEDANVAVPQRKYFARSLVQKLNLLSDRLIVAVAADDLAQAIDVVGSLEFIANSPDLSAEMVNRVLEAIEPRRRDKVSLIVGVIEPDPNEAQRAYVGFIELNTERVGGGALGLVTVGGSGQDGFLRTLERIAGDLTSFDQAKKPVLKASAVGLTLACAFYGQEVSSPANLGEAWGGGFEVAVFDQGRFHKLDNILYLFWKLTDNGDGSHTLTLMHKMMKSQYWGDALLLRVLELEKDKDGNRSTNDWTHLIPSLPNMAGGYDLTAISAPSFDSNWRCSFIHAPQPGNSTPRRFTRVSYHGEGSKDISYGIEDGKLRLSVSRQTYAEVCTFLKDAHGYNIRETRFASKNRG
jgi:hypothetical protein